MLPRNIYRYLKYLHQERLDGFAFINNSLTSNFQPANLLRINSILLEKGSNSCQTEDEQ